MPRDFSTAPSLASKLSRSDCKEEVAMIVAVVVAGRWINSNPLTKEGREGGRLEVVRSGNESFAQRLGRQ